MFVHSTCVGHTFRVNGSGEVDYHHNALVALLIVAEQLDHSVGTGFVQIGWRIVAVHMSIFSCIDFSMPIVVKVQGRDLHGFCSVVRH